METLSYKTVMIFSYLILIKIGLLIAVEVGDIFLSLGLITVTTNY